MTELVIKTRTTKIRLIKKEDFENGDGIGIDFEKIDEQNKRVILDSEKEISEPFTNFIVFRYDVVDSANGLVVENQTTYELE